MKKNLAIFDFDQTIKEHSPKFITAGGMSTLFPNQEIPKHLWKIMKEQGLYEFSMAVISAINELNVTEV